jgi:hypothetical protein
MQHPNAPRAPCKVFTTWSLLKAKSGHTLGTPGFTLRTAPHVGMSTASLRKKCERAGSRSFLPLLRSKPARETLGDEVGQGFFG